MTNRIKTIPGAEFGQNGFAQLGVETKKGDFYALVPVGGAATFSATTDKGDALASVTVSEAVPIYGRFSEVVVTAGSVLAYHAEDAD